MTVRIETSNRVATVIIDRPDVRNAVDGPTADALNDAFVALDSDAAIDVCVLWGSGGTFCAGADLRALGTDRGNQLTAEGPGPMGPTRLVMSKPVIAAIEGYAVAGGLELALWCDLRVAAETAVFGVFNRRWGVPLVDGGTVRLPRLVGYGTAMDLILTGREVLSREAKDIGLINRMVPTGSARIEAELLAADLSRYPQAGMGNDRVAVIEGFGRPEDEAMRREFTLGMDTLASGEAAAGAARFVDGEGRHSG